MAPIREGFARSKIRQTLLHFSCFYTQRDYNKSMNQKSNLHEYIGLGLYSLPEASRLLKASPRNLRRWMAGYDYRRGDDLHHVAALWEPDLPRTENHVEISFRDLIELRFVKAFLEKGIGLKAVRNCLEYANECIQSDRPFSSGRFRTDGRTIFLESLEAAKEPKLLDLKGKQYVFKQVVEQSFKDLDLEGDIVTRWRPYRGKSSIVVDPARSFGQPVAAASGVPTIVLAEAFYAEGSASAVAAMYEVDESVVRDAVRFHEELLAA
ncbi:hypothetical protein PhaeoP30_02854 [Phaeobacter inhibens]|uniref:hypothetical protein n=1 Tax=Phaeobacter inhibens TaxID=221822 RepID=UPI000CA11D3C|nr:hypothetical protein [Phaeobacter inhibens]AUQ59738.1 hypothetical protein PhaeoP30_02854 [Phaeobacter inhibens]